MAEPRQSPSLYSTPSSYSNYSNLEDLIKPHIDSFDHFLDSGIESLLSHIKPVKIIDPNTKQKLQISFGAHELNAPVKERVKGGFQTALLPFECRQAKLSYSGKFTVEVCFTYEGSINPIREKFNFGNLPIMLKSKNCHLRGADPKKLVSYREEPTEMGGYFIVNGLERLIRFLIMPKRNYAMSVLRDTFRERQEGYTDKAIVIRCVRDDQSSVTNKLYYLHNGSARLGFWVKGREFLLPVGVLLKALIDTNDHEIYASLTCGYSDKYRKEKGAIGTLVGERVKIILDEVRDLSLFTRAQCIQHIGEYFRPVMDGMEDETHSFVGEAVLEEYILVHIKSYHDKFNLLIFMLQKLFAFVDLMAAQDNTDALQNHEVLQPGHLIIIYLKEKLQEWLFKARRLLQDELQKNSKFGISDVTQVKKVMDRNSSRSIGLAIESMLKTGRLVTQSGLDLQQRGGMTVQAERLNFLRFISHFRSVHRGAAFAGHRSTAVRKLLPEAWGFLCPVHTPDGEPCGLLNHLASTCRITSFYNLQGEMKDFFKLRLSILNVLIGIGMTPSLPKLVRAGPPEVLFVLLDGCVIGSISSNLVEKAVQHIRKLKLLANSGIPEDLEVGHVPFSKGGAYPGLYLSTSPSRFIRPVKSMSPDAPKDRDIELIGPFEQVYMEIRCADGGEGGRTNDNPPTHEEIHPTGILSVVANLTPYSDHNQSPRNMYQCQMAKQTVGFSSQALRYRADQKLYHLQTPQTPIVRTTAYTKYNIDEFPTGTNAIVAVLAYTGYDMEDAMILNKSSVERGMCHTSIYQLESIDLEDQSGKTDPTKKTFHRSVTDKSSHSSIDLDGLPYVGKTIYPDEPYYSTYDSVTGQVRQVKLKGTEPVTVDYVSIDAKNTNKPPQKVNIRFRRPRNPIIGDKFSSRHGQKGVCSQLWPDIDMPFNGTTGMRPDLIINPHAFPSRMTIGMLMESIAAKGGSLNGKFVNATPFASSAPKNKESSSNDDDSEKKAEEKTKSTKPTSLIDELGPILASHGFNYHGLEVLYSGVLGTELVCEIFIGPVYYQRLRHMVSDKFQVRNTGPVDPTTKQPMKGRKRGGGIRFGEMERDSLLAHGAAYLLHDRLHTCSDFHVADVCSICGSILTTSFIQPQRRAERAIGGLPPGKAPKKVACHACKTSKGMETVAMPYVFRYLAAELAAMNVKMTLKLSNGAEV
ncbi:DNA-directed RNA polymerase [Ranunculus cassubicifolius]